MLYSKSIGITGILLLSFISLFMFINLELAHSSSFTGYETQIFYESNESKVKKLQEVFKGLGLYDGEISGKFEDIEKNLLNYQLKKGIINHIEDHGAGYFGAKTMKALEEDFGELYLNLKENFLKVDEVSKEKRHFQVTAYYSPLPGQTKYTTGTYSGDIKLNGNGHNTASGNGMYQGLLAGPRNYPFGTKIYLEGLGIGEIGDRGGAIVNAGERGHEFDRLDIWVGYGDEGRERARQWGRRDIYGYVVEDTYVVDIEFDQSPIAMYSKLRVDGENPSTESVEKLQSLFKELNLYEGEIDGIYESIKDTLVNYQIDKGIIKTKEDTGAGYFGLKTFEQLQKDYGKTSGLFIEKYIDNATNLKTNKLPANYDDYLSNIQKSSLHALKNKLNERFDKIYKGNQEKTEEFKKQFKAALEAISESPKYNNRRYEFKYLIEIL